VDIKQLLQDYGVHYLTEGHKHCREGWVNIPCPFCAGSPGYHLGIHENGNGTHCWRCGTHPISKILSRVLNLAEPQVWAILQKYKITRYRKQIIEPTVSIFPLKFPKPNTKLTPQYKEYLVKRGFDPDKLKKEWGLSQTGPVSFLDGISYSHRILIPIHWNKEIVSFQGRDITDKSKLKYLACPKKREKIHHKDIVYGKQEDWSGTLIIVEGVTDVWRFGVHAVATFGIEFKMEQVLQLKDAGDEFFIVFDDESQAQRQARELMVKLKALGKKVYIETVKGDPGGMKQDDADHFVRQLLKRR